MIAARPLLSPTIHDRSDKREPFPSSANQLPTEYGPHTSALINLFGALRPIFLSTNAANERYERLISSYVYDESELAST